MNKNQTNNIEKDKEKNAKLAKKLKENIAKRKKLKKT
tara:strand:+ start:151 stop:261 length:111 start_codon:yes stop_codon:yes gene_type:complete